MEKNTKSKYRDKCQKEIKRANDLYQNPQFIQCLSNFQIDLSIYQKINEFGADITCENFMQFVQQKTDYYNKIIKWKNYTEYPIMLDIFTHINMSFTMGKNVSTYGFFTNTYQKKTIIAKYHNGFDTVFYPYGFLSTTDRKTIITASYYIWHKNRIRQITEKFPSECYEQILYKIRHVPKSLINMALVCKSFYQIICEFEVNLRQAQICPKCNSNIFRRSIKNVCVSCTAKDMCVKYLLKPIISVFECIEPYVENLDSDILVKMAHINKEFYLMAKRIIISVRTPIVIDCQKCPNKICPNKICMPERSIDHCHNICGKCLYKKVYYVSTVPKLNWAQCYRCGNLFFIKLDYLGLYAKCRKCR